MAPRSQPYRVESPLNAEQARNIDEMFQILFDDIRNGALIINLATQVTGTLAVTHGGTGLTSWAVGDVVYASATTTLAGLTVGSVGKIIRSTGTLPAYTTFTIPDTFVQGDVIYGSAANVLTALAKNASATRYLSNTGASNNPAWAQVDLTNGVTGTLPVGSGGTGTATTFTQGSVVFAGGSGIYTQDNSNFFWDDASNFLGIGTSGSPAAALDILTANVRVRLGGSSGIAMRIGGTYTGGSFGITLDELTLVPTVNNSSVGVEANVNVSRAASGTHPLFVGMQAKVVVGAGTTTITDIISAQIKIPTGTLTNATRATSLYVEGAPSGATTNRALWIEAGDSEIDGKLGLGQMPTAVLHIKAGTATATTAPLKFTSGTVLTSAEAGAVEFLTDGYYATTTTGPTRRQILLNSSATAYTTGSIPFAVSGGYLSENNSKLFWDNTNFRLGVAVGTSPSVTVHAKGQIRSTRSDGFNILEVNAEGGAPKVRALSGASAVFSSFDITTEDIDAVTHYVLSGASGNATNYGRVTLGANTPQDVRFRVTNPGDNVAGICYTAGIAPASLLSAASYISLSALSGTEGGIFVVDYKGRVGIGQASPTAFCHLPAGTATASTAPFKFTSGTLLTSAEAGAMEYDGTDLFFTRAGTVRENVLVAIDNVTAPTTNIGVAIANYYGSAATNYLGDPNRWLSVNILGSTYKIPLYT